MGGTPISTNSVSNGNGHTANGYHFEQPTLSTFSLAGSVCVVTGGAQGLGLVMSRALVFSGAEVAIVDLNSKSPSEFLPGGSKNNELLTPISKRI